MGCRGCGPGVGVSCLSASHTRHAQGRGTRACARDAGHTSRAVEVESGVGDRGPGVEPAPRRHTLRTR